MGLFTRKQICKICEVTKGYLNVYIGRGIVIVTGKMIDDTIPQNDYFIQKHKDKIAAKNGEEVKDKLQKYVKPVSKEMAEEAIKNENGGVNQHNLAKYNLELQKRELDIIKAEEEIEITKMKRAKMAGELIPTDLVLLLFASHFKNVTTSFHQATEILITTIAKQNNLDRKQIAKIRGELIVIINSAINDAMGLSKKELKNLVTEYSIKRERGERI